MKLLPTLEKYDKGAKLGKFRGRYYKINHVVHLDKIMDEENKKNLECQKTLSSPSRLQICLLNWSLRMDLVILRMTSLYRITFYSIMKIIGFWIALIIRTIFILFELRTQGQWLVKNYELQILYVLLGPNDNSDQRRSRKSGKGHNASQGGYHVFEEQ